MLRGGTAARFLGSHLQPFLSRCRLFTVACWKMRGHCHALRGDCHARRGHCHARRNALDRSSCTQRLPTPFSPTRTTRGANTGLACRRNTRVSFDTHHMLTWGPTLVFASHVSLLASSHVSLIASHALAFTSLHAHGFVWHTSSCGCLWGTRHSLRRLPKLLLFP